MTDQTPDPLDPEEALSSLVNQFADPLAFLRELVQNAVDAGSRAVDVRVEHQPDDDDPAAPGAVVIHVDDHGEGMDRQVIDTKLTRLFSSSKEGDLTKIGRFGIGFVSVFALDPDAVCVDTGRGGERWRVLFHRDRTFSRLALDTPVEGTRIRIVKTMPAAEATALRDRARAVLDHWCRHLAVEVRLDGVAINRPFDLEAGFRIRHTEGPATLVVGYTPDGSRSGGFYNRGLTLHETTETPLPRVAFKIDSPELEHTLTRDRVVEDAAHARLLTTVARLARHDLPAALAASLEVDLRAGGPAAGRDTACRLLAAAIREPALGLPDELGPAAIFRTVSGRPLTVGEVRRAAARDGLLLDAAGGRVGLALEGTGRVVACGDEPATVDLLEAIAGRTLPAATAAYCVAERLPAGSVPAELSALAAAAGTLLEALRVRVGAVAFAALTHPGSAVAHRVAITQAQAGEVTPVTEARRLARRFLAARRDVVLNLDHPTVAALGRRAAAEPELAAYLLLKCFFLPGELDLETDATLAAAAWELRCRRPTV
jgi:hypothetical protein